MSLRLSPNELLTYTTTVYMVSLVVVKLQLIFDGVTLSHSFGDGGVGLITTITASRCGTYSIDDGVAYCSIVEETMKMYTYSCKLIYRKSGYFNDPKFPCKILYNYIYVTVFA